MGSELTVTEVWRYPVKSMGGELMPSIDIGPGGVRLDRGWAVRDERVGAIRSARYIPSLLMCSARYLPDTSAGYVPHVEITLPDGSTVNSDDTKANARLSEAIGKSLTLCPLDLTSDPDHTKAFLTDGVESEMRLLFGLADDEPLPDLSGFDDGSAKLEPQMGSFLDAFPISIIKRSSIRFLQNLVPDENLDTRRFRANIIIDDSGERTELREHEWIGKTACIGPAKFDVSMAIPRCTMIAAPQPGLDKNSSITRAVVREMSQCIGVYCNVRNTGTIEIGDALNIV